VATGSASWWPAKNSESKAPRAIKGLPSPGQVLGAGCCRRISSQRALCAAATAHWQSVAGEPVSGIGCIWLLDDPNRENRRRSRPLLAQAHSALGGAAPRCRSR